MRRAIKPSVLKALLELVSYDVPLEVLARRSARDRAEAEEWACQVHLRTSDNAFVRVPERPAWLAAYEIDRGEPCCVHKRNAKLA